MDGTERQQRGALLRVGLEHGLDLADRTGCVARAGHGVGAQDARVGVLRVLLEELFDPRLGVVESPRQQENFGGFDLCVSIVWKRVSRSYVGGKRRARVAHSRVGFRKLPVGVAVLRVDLEGARKLDDRELVFLVRHVLIALANVLDLLLLRVAAAGKARDCE
jgi:hypothetical protein